MEATPLTYLGPLGGKRMLVCGVGVEAVGFALAGADVYGFDASAAQVEAVKDLARRLGLREHTHLQTMELAQLHYPDDFFDLVLGKTVRDDGNLETGAKELERVMKRGGRAAFIVAAGTPADRSVRRVFGSAVSGKCWIGVEKAAE
jgi:SAM-dependent methyltransferase